MGIEGRPGATSQLVDAMYANMRNADALTKLLAPLFPHLPDFQVEFWLGGTNRNGYPQGIGVSWSNRDYAKRKELDDKGLLYTAD